MGRAHSGKYRNLHRARRIGFYHGVGAPTGPPLGASTLRFAPPRYPEPSSTLAPAAAHNTRRYEHPLFGVSWPIGAGLCRLSRRRELPLYGVLGNSCRLSPMKIAPVPSQQPVVDTVLIGSPLLVVLRSGALVTHPDLLHHPARSRVAPQVLRVDAVQP